MIKREMYLEKLRKLRDQNIIKVVTGIRRSGKSTLFAQFRDELLASGVDEKNIIFLNLEELDNQDLLDYRLLHDYIVRMTDPKKRNYVFLDEVQNVPKFEKMADSLFVKGYIDLYLTGSNAYMWSSELATFLSGRYIEIRILPFSFYEFMQGFPAGTDSIKGFSEYLKLGGFPEVSNLLHGGAMSEITDYLNNIYTTVLEKDVIGRKRVRSRSDFESVLRFAFDSVGSLVSANNIANILSTNGNIVNRETVENYLSALVDSYVLYRADRYDVKGKRILQTLNKYYTVDVGLMRVLLGKDELSDRGHILENVVYLELLRRNSKVWVGKVDTKEVDFVVQTKSGETEYYQVAETMVGSEVRDRELGALLKIRNHNPKYIITNDFGEASYDGIRQINVIDWLLDG